MAAKDRMAVLPAMMDQGVIPVFYHPDIDVCNKVIQACANGGAKCIEFTNRGDFAAHVFLEVDAPFRQGRSQRDHGRRFGRRRADGRHLHRQRRQVRRRTDAQRRCRQGLQPPQDSLQPRLRLGARRSRYAEELGCEIVKVFPGVSRRRARISSRTCWARCPWTRIMPTGGVDATEESLHEVVRRRHRRVRHRLEPDHQGAARRPRIMPASRRRCARPSRSSSASGESKP